MLAVSCTHSFTAFILSSFCRFLATFSSALVFGVFPVRGAARDMVEDQLWHKLVQAMTTILVLRSAGLHTQPPTRSPTRLTDRLQVSRASGGLQSREAVEIVLRARVGALEPIGLCNSARCDPVRLVFCPSTCRVPSRNPRSHDSASRRGRQTAPRRKKDSSIVATSGGMPDRCLTSAPTPAAVEDSRWRGAFTLLFRRGRRRPLSSP